MFTIIYSPLGTSGRKIKAEVSQRKDREQNSRRIPSKRKSQKSVEDNDKDVKQKLRDKPKDNVDFFPK